MAWRRLLPASEQTSSCRSSAHRVPGLDSPGPLPITQMGKWRPDGLTQGHPGAGTMLCQHISEVRNANSAESCCLLSPLSDPGTTQALRLRDREAPSYHPLCPRRMPWPRRPSKPLKVTQLPAQPGWNPGEPRLLPAQAWHGPSLRRCATCPGAWAQVPGRCQGQGLSVPQPSPGSPQSPFHRPAPHPTGEARQNRQCWDYFSISRWIRLLAPSRASHHCVGAGGAAPG